jgi:ketosteroid isomerase-like protein
MGDDGMSGPADPQAFAEEWIAAWNARDLDKVLTFFAEDAVFSSPLAAKVVPESGGTVRGKAALRDYWGAALAQNPELNFELTALDAGIDVLLIGFRMNGGADRVEVLRFRGGLVVEGCGTYRVG